MSQCDACGADLPVGARFCAQCGHRVAVAEEAPAAMGQDYAAEFDARDTQKIAREMFQAHVDLLRKYRGQVRELQRRADGLDQKLAEAEESPPSAENTRRTQELLEQLETLGDAWDDVQRSYNADSETLDEEFLDRMSEMELDVELPDRLQAKILEEHEGMSEELARLSESMRALGDRGGRVIGRATGRWTGAAGAGGANAGRGWVLVLIALGAAAAVVLSRPDVLNWGWNVAAIAAGSAAVLVFLATTPLLRGRA